MQSGPIVRLPNGTAAEGLLPATSPRLEDLMIGRVFSPSDPFEGRGVYRRQLRRRIEGMIALALAVTACGVTAAMWLRTLAPVLGVGPLN